MDQTEDTLLIAENQTLSFQEMADLIVELQSKVSNLESSLETRSFGKTEFQDKDVRITKGIILAGVNDEVAVMSGVDPLYRFWAGAEDPANANFTVDKNGNINSVGGTITGATLRTAATGERIEIDSTNVNQIRFYNDTDLYGVIEVHDVLGSGYMTFGVVAGDSIEAGMRIDVDVGASGYNSVDLVSNGGGFSTNGNASTGYNVINGKTGTYLGIQTVATVDYMMTDLLPSSDPGVVGAFYEIAGAVMISL